MDTSFIGGLALYLNVNMIIIAVAPCYAYNPISMHVHLCETIFMNIGDEPTGSHLQQYECGSSCDSN